MTGDTINRGFIEYSIIRGTELSAGASEENKQKQRSTN